MKPIPVNHLFSLFGINIDQRMQAANSFIEGRRVFKEAKQEVREKFKKLAFNLHPDRNKENGNNGNEEKFKELSAAKTALESIELRERPRPVMIHVSRVIINIGNYDTSTTGSFTGW